MQSADDLGRELDGIWLGPPNSWRWPVDWTFKKWGLFAASLIVSFILMALVVPMGAIAFGMAWWAARTMAPTINRDAPRRWHWAILGAIGFVLFVFLPSPRAWLLPVWFPLVFLVAPAVGFMVVRLYGRFLTWNTPLRYWLRVPRLVAAGPRLRVTRTIDPNRLALPYTQNPPLAPAAAVLPAFRPVDVLHVTAGNLEADNGGWHEEEIASLTPAPVIEAVVLKPPVALGIDVASEFMSIAREGGGTVEVETYPMPPAKHPFVKRIPGGLYFHRLNYKIEWGPR